MEIQENKPIDKLKGIPTVYYFNLDNRTDRKEYMENQFNEYGISFFRVSQSKYLASEWKEWEHLIQGKVYGKENTFMPWVTANAISHIEFLKYWLENTNEEMLIIMEDDYDLSLIPEWHFTWEYMMNRIPYDWDCVQLGFQSFHSVKCFLHPKEATQYLSGGFGPCLLNRRYVSKIVDIHFKNDKFILNGVLADSQLLEHGNSSPSMDYMIVENGRTYCLPLIPMNNDLGSYENNIPVYYPHHIICREIYYHWWHELKDSFSLNDFFTYNKPNDWNMTYDVQQVGIQLGIYKYEEEDTAYERID